MFKKKKVNLIHFFLDVMLLYDMIFILKKQHPKGMSIMYVLMETQVLIKVCTSFQK